MIRGPREEPLKRSWGRAGGEMRKIEEMVCLEETYFWRTKIERCCATPTKLFDVFVRCFPELGNCSTMEHVKEQACWAIENCIVVLTTKMPHDSARQCKTPTGTTTEQLIQAKTPGGSCPMSLGIPTWLWRSASFLWCLFSVTSEQKNMGWNAKLRNKLVHQEICILDICFILIYQPVVKNRPPGKGPTRWRGHSWTWTSSESSRECGRILGHFGSTGRSGGSSFIFWKLDIWNSYGFIVFVVHWCSLVSSLNHLVSADVLMIFMRFGMIYSSNLHLRKFKPPTNSVMFLFDLYLVFVDAFLLLHDGALIVNKVHVVCQTQPCLALRFCTNVNLLSQMVPNLNMSR